MEVKKRFPEGIPQLDPIENMGIKDEGFKKLVRVSIFLIWFSQRSTLLITNLFTPENRGLGI